MTTSLYEKVGQTKTPLDESQVSTTIRVVADPAQSVLLEFCKQIILSECGAAFDVAKMGTKLADGYVVNTAIPFEPSPFFAQQLKFVFPVISCHRVKSESVQHTLNYTRSTTEWQVSYILGELNIIELGRLYSTLHGVESALQAYLDRGFHPDYNDGYPATDAGGFYELSLASCEYGSYKLDNDSDGIFLPAINMTIKTIEVQGNEAQYNTIEGVDGYFSLAETLDTEVDFNFEIDPDA